MTDCKNILLTGATGFIGRHIHSLLEAEGLKVATLSRRPGADIVCNLEKEEPAISQQYDVVVHAAGTYDFERADALNNQGTKRLLAALERNVPRQIIFISTVHVYGLDPGEDVEESCFLRPDTPYSRSKIRAEKDIEKWCGQHGVVCTILRPAVTVGSGMHGRMAKLADAISKGYYMHLRKNPGKRSLVMAEDVAQAVWLTMGVPGAFNVTDGEAHSVIDIADAMAANFDTNKRILSMPAGLVKWGLRLCPLSKLRKAYATLTATTTFSNKKLREATGFTPYNTVEVMARRHPDYPYKEK